MSFAAPCTPCVLPHPQLPPFVLRVMEAHPTAADVVQSGLSIIHNLIISEPGPAVMALIRPCIPFTLRALRQLGDVEKVVAPAVVILQITSMVRLLLACGTGMGWWVLVRVKFGSIPFAVAVADLCVE